MNYVHFFSQTSILMKSITKYICNGGYASENICVISLYLVTPKHIHVYCGTIYSTFKISFIQKFVSNIWLWKEIMDFKKYFQKLQSNSSAILCYSSMTSVISCFSHKVIIIYVISLNGSFRKHILCKSFQNMYICNNRNLKTTEMHVLCVLGQ